MKPSSHSRLLRLPVPSRAGKYNAHPRAYSAVYTMVYTCNFFFDQGAGENAELLALQRIDDTAVKLQQEGKYLEALECMERGLVLRQHFFGADSEEVWRACKTVGEMCNLLAMTYLQQEDFGMVLELLKKADILTERDEAGRAVTFNNLACYYRRQGKLHASLSYLQKALRIESRLPDCENPADTHLNMCAVLSQLGRHAAALEHAQSALILLQEELFGGVAAGGAPPPGTLKADRIAVLAIAYHNIGVEQEFLKKFTQSVQSYQKGVDVAKTHLGPDHGITITLRNSLLAAKRAIQSRSGKTTSAGKGRKPGTARKGAARAARGPGSPSSPSRADEKRWGSISGAYGDIPGVQPVSRGQSPKKKASSRAAASPSPKPVSRDAAPETAGAEVDLTGRVGGADATNDRSEQKAVEADVSEEQKAMITPRGGAPADDAAVGGAGHGGGEEVAEEGKLAADIEAEDGTGAGEDDADGGAAAGDHTGDDIGGSGEATEDNQTGATAGADDLDEAKRNESRMAAVKADAEHARGSSGS